ncbi:hypothetical protein BKA83DRAFT_4128014 [Pisolithus microcarpus]|nr:hypothetical protein BKA83DRAFT_4128014 [Pisolithus microcarpus]
MSANTFTSESDHQPNETSDRCQLTTSWVGPTSETINDGVVKALNALVPPLRVFSVFMARTKQTAGKTTCGAAPRVEFFHPTHTAFSKAASRAMESTSSLSSLTTAPSSRAPSPDSTGETALEQWDTNRVVSTDTGSIATFVMTVANSYLPAIPVQRVVCQRCLGLREDLMKKVCAVDTNFHCPGCHELRDGASKRNLTPYFTQGSLPLLLKTTLDEYHTKASLEYTEVTFDFGTQKKLNRWRAKAKKLGAKLGASDFKRKIIFVTVHSEVTRGDLFSGKDEKGGDVAMRVEEFMSCLFSPPLEEVVYASTLFMLTCGPLVSFQESFTSMQQSIRHQSTPSHLPALNFINAVLKPFLVSYGVQVLIEGHALGDVLQDLLNVSLGLRMHSDVILFHVAGLISSKAPFLLRRASLATTPLVTGYRYSWYHSHRRPWGNSLPIGCKKCAAIRPWGRSKLDPQPDQPKARVTKCQSKGCDFEVRTQPLPHEYQVLRGDETSGWLKYVICAAEPL